MPLTPESYRLNTPETREEYINRYAFKKSKHKAMPKKKKGFLEGYKTYDPAVEGYGSSSQWRENFRYRMGFEEAVERLGKTSPLSVLGLPESTADWSVIKAAYRKLALRYHPDVCKDDDATERMKAINAAYTVLERKYGK